MIYLLSLLLFSSCLGSRDTKYLLFEPPPESIETDSRLYSIKSFLQITQIDILFVVDNSGSMGSIQKNVASNAAIFMEKFALNNSIDWKIGIVSTDDKQDPFLGFNQPFDSSLLVQGDSSSFQNVVDTFQRGIDSLGVNGSPLEYMFYNTVRHLDAWNGGNGRPSFLRSNAHLIVIMVGDEEPQSEDKFGEDYSVDGVIDHLRTKINSDAVLRFYGAMGQGDMTGCESNSWNSYNGLDFEKIIDQTGGFAISACLDDFGTELARIGEDIATLVKVPKLALRNRPKLETIEILYNGKELKPGRPENGGVWYYDFQTNTINFYNIDFVEDIDNDNFDITFQVEDGIDRE